MSAILEVKDLTFSYDKESPLVLKGVDLEIEAGSFTAVLGHN